MTRVGKRVLVGLRWAQLFEVDGRGPREPVVCENGAGADHDSVFDGDCGADVDHGVDLDAIADDDIVGDVGSFRRRCSRCRSARRGGCGRCPRSRVPSPIWTSVFDQGRGVDSWRSLCFTPVLLIQTVAGLCRCSTGGPVVLARAIRTRPRPLRPKRGRRRNRSAAVSSPLMASREVDDLVAKGSDLVVAVAEAHPLG